MKPASALAVFVFCLVAFFHLLRVLFQTEVLVGGTIIPVWVSMVGFIVTGALAAMLWREAQPDDS